MRTFAVHAARMYDRWYFLAIFVTGYVALAALRHVGPEIAVLAVLVGNPLLLAQVWRKTRPGRGLIRSDVHAAALTAARVAAWGAGLWIAARVAAVGGPAFDIAANLGLASAVVSAHVALARIVHREGLIQAPRSARSLDAAVLSGVVWVMATAPALVSTAWPGKGPLLDLLASERTTLIASLASWGVLMAAALRCRVTRSLELGVAERATGVIALSLTASGAALGVAAARLVAWDRALSLGALAAALACVWACTARDPAAVSRVWRRAIVVTLLGVPVVLGVGALARATAQLGEGLTIAGAAIALGVGLWVPSLAERLARGQSRWLSALHAASRAALVPEPNAAIVATLSSLQAVEHNVPTRPELWRLDPPQVLSVDVAGYLHTTSGEAPSGLFELARSEPEHMLRREVLARLEVRRPEVRPVLAWMDARDAFAVTLVCDEQAPLGFLLFPRGSRTRPVTLAEAEAARQLTDRLSAVLSLSSSMARAREREQHALRRAELLEQEARRLSAIIAEHERPRDLLVDALAASARVAAYSARSRLTLEGLERLGAGGLDATLQVPVGIDPMGWACVFHLASPRRTGPLVVADGTVAAAHAAEHWTQLITSPGSRAQGGTLLLLNAAAMPLAAQDALAIALSRRATAAPGAESFGLIASVADAPRELLEARHLSRALAQFLLPNVVPLPALVERAEDLRGLILDRLCRSGVRYAGAPLGIEPQALSLLVDHDWPGNDAELASVVARAARVASGQRVSVADLAAVGFLGPPLEPDAVTALPRRRSERPSGVRAPDDGAAERPLVRRRRRR